MMNIDKLFEKALAKGLSDVQVYLNNSTQLSIEVFAGELDKYEIADTSSLTIRGVLNGKMGTYVTEVMDDSLIDGIVDHLIENAKVIDSLDDAIIYAGDKFYQPLEGLFNEELANKPVAEKIESVKQLDKLFHESDSRLTIAETMYSETTRSMMIQNTKGLKLYNKVNSAYLGGSVIVKDDKDQRTGFDIEITNEFSDFNPEKLAKEIVDSATEKLGAGPIASGPYEIVFDRGALATLLSAFSNIFSADAVHKGFSLLRGKLNEEVGSKLVTIVDDPFMKKSSSSRSFDDEGVATKYKELISAGVLKTYLHNLVTAKKDGVESTGNGLRGNIAAVNLKFLPGESSLDDILATVKHGVYITDVQGAHAGANPVSGDFSLQASGFVVNDGKKADPVALITVAGNFIAMLKDITMVANDLKMSYYGITCPSVKVKSMAVAGK
ncbi:MAG: TldD/PmbA family protein [Candidatus Izemoplasmatales bacterium]|nr:TldD/PmbA family protein [Candidatus Izemoplasmatales bacterium]